MAGVGVTDVGEGVGAGVQIAALRAGVPEGEKHWFAVAVLALYQAVQVSEYPNPEPVR